jgi:hypothetical protein
MADRVLTARELNRALLARQGLLERVRVPVPEMVERLVGMQAQVPWNPYLALWDRIEGFAVADLSDLLAGHALARTTAMRATLHLLTARDLRSLVPLMAPVAWKAFAPPFGKGLRGADPHAVAAAAAELLAGGRAMTRVQFGEALAPRWPDADPVSLGQAAVHHNTLVQVTPRGEWRGSGPVAWALAAEWLDAPMEDPAPVGEVVLRYLRSFGPASAADVRTWSRLTGLRPVLESLRPQLRTFRDERGRELLDVPDGLLPDPGTPAPPRFLPEFDNVALAHDDRSRFMAGAPQSEWPRGPMIGGLWVDGFCRAPWRIDRAGGVATLTIFGLRRLRSDPAGTRAAIRAEGEAVLGFLVAEDEGRVEFVAA